jgi:hypothetical protein
MWESHDPPTSMPNLRGSSCDRPRKVATRSFTNVSEPDGAAYQVCAGMTLSVACSCVDAAVSRHVDAKR